MRKSQGRQGQCNAEGYLLLLISKYYYQNNGTIIKIEEELDNKLKELGIWELPFQTILSWLLLTTDDRETNEAKHNQQKASKN